MLTQRQIDLCMAVKDAFYGATFIYCAVEKDYTGVFVDSNVIPMSGLYAIANVTKHMDAKGCTIQSIVVNEKPKLIIRLVAS